MLQAASCKTQWPGAHGRACGLPLGCERLGGSFRARSAAEYQEGQPQEARQPGWRVPPGRRFFSLPGYGAWSSFAPAATQPVTASFWRRSLRVRPIIAEYSTLYVFGLISGPCALFSLA